MKTKMEKKFDDIHIFGFDDLWMKYCYRSASKIGKVRFYYLRFPIKWKFLLKCCRWHFIKNYPCKSIWWPVFFMGMELWKKKSRLIIIHDWNEVSKSATTISFLKKFAKVVYFFTNIHPIVGANVYGLYENLKLYDGVFSFDSKEAEKNKYHHLLLPYEPELESNCRQNDDVKYDVFFVGQAKNRLDIIHEVYKDLTKQGIKCDFWVTNVESNQIKFPGIHYNQFLSYSDVIEKIKQSRCLFDPIQGGSTGYTLRVPESVYYEKKLISTNAALVGSSFYNPKKILIIKESGLSKVDISNICYFIRSGKISYSQKEKDIFSFDSFINSITNALNISL